MEDFLIKLNNLCETLDRNYDINSGGCCFISYLIAKNLKKFGIKYSFIVYDGDDVLPKTAFKKLVFRKIIKTKERILKHSCNHYCITVGNFIINQGDFTKRYYSCYCCACINPEEIEYIYKVGCWNSYYDTRNNKEITKIIENFFNDNLT